MNLKDLFNNFFAYTPKNNYEFDIPESSNTTSYNNSDENAPKEKTKIFPSLIVNIEYIKTKYNLLINSDVILKPLMLRNKNNLYDGSQNKVISESVTNNITIRKVKKFDLPNYLMGCLMPQNAVKEIFDFDEAANGINSRKLYFIC